MASELLVECLMRPHGERLHRASPEICHRASQATAEILDRLANSFLEFAPAAPSRGLALARVMSGWRTFGSSTGSGLYSIFALRAGDADDLLRELLDRHLARIADVHRLVEIAIARAGKCRRSNPST